MPSNNWNYPTESSNFTYKAFGLYPWHLWTGFTRTLVMFTSSLDFTLSPAFGRIVINFLELGVFHRAYDMTSTLVFYNDSGLSYNRSGLVS